MTEQPASQRAATILPPQSANDTSPELPSAPSAPSSGRMHTRIGGMRTSLIAGFAGALLMAAAGTARIGQLRQIMRRDRHKPPGS
ncbi:MAG TPA: hypothetical protein VNW50_09635 [Streptosporangiaceae bacterium]|nr:hypothetical protein [Streptosporangiaceae bacterium]